MLKITINNQLNQDVFYAEITLDNIRNQIMGIGYVWAQVSRNKDMSNPFSVMINPNNCSVITYEEVSQ